MESHLNTDQQDPISAGLSFSPTLQAPPFYTRRPPIPAKRLPLSLAPNSISPSPSSSMLHPLQRRSQLSHLLAYSPIYASLSPLHSLRPRRFQHLHPPIFHTLLIFDVSFFFDHEKSPHLSLFCKILFLSPTASVQVAFLSTLLNLLRRSTIPLASWIPIPFSFPSAVSSYLAFRAQVFSRTTPACFLPLSIIYLCLTKILLSPDLQPPPAFLPIIQVSCFRC